MKKLRTIADLTGALENGNQLKWLHFWGHRPSADGTLTRTCFSQWWNGHPFEINGIEYMTAEHFMMAEKARLFSDDDVLKKVLVADSPGLAKKLGRSVSGFDESQWKQERWNIVVRGNLAKFGQHKDLSDLLLRTGQRILVEASPFDRIWGIGMGATHADSEKPAKWKGLNLLGFALMEVRDQLAAAGVNQEN